MSRDTCLTVENSAGEKVQMNAPPLCGSAGTLAQNELVFLLIYLLAIKQHRTVHITSLWQRHIETDRHTSGTDTTTTTAARPGDAGPPTSNSR